MKKKALFLLLLVAGCASKPVWEHPTKDSAEFKTEEAECERFFGGNDREVLRCLDRKGWKQRKR